MTWLSQPAAAGVASSYLAARCSAWRFPTLWILDQVQYDGGDGG